MEISSDNTKALMLYQRKLHFKVILLQTENFTQKLMKAHMFHLLFKFPDNPISLLKFAYLKLYKFI